MYRLVYLNNTRFQLIVKRSQTDSVNKNGPNLKQVLHFWIKPETFQENGLKLKYPANYKDQILGRDPVQPGPTKPS